MASRRPSTRRPSHSVPVGMMWSTHQQVVVPPSMPTTKRPGSAQPSAMHGRVWSVLTAVPLLEVVQHRADRRALRVDWVDGELAGLGFGLHHRHPARWAHRADVGLGVDLADRLLAEPDGVAADV